MKINTIAASLLIATVSFGREQPVGANDLIPPSTPLVACDPYFSIWSPADKLTDTDTTHWTGKKHPLRSVLMIDGTGYRVMGTAPETLAAFEQKSLTVLPTRTIYTFAGAGIGLTLTFTTPALPEDMALLSRPVTYITYDLTATDGKDHSVGIFFGAGAEIAVNQPEQSVQWSSENIPGLSFTKIGSTQQKILGSKGDDHRIDWGYFYMAAPAENTAQLGFDRPGKLAESWLAAGKWPSDAGKGKANECGAGLALKPLKVGAKPVSTWLMVAYDDLFSIQYNHQNLRPYWRKNGWEAADLLTASKNEYAALLGRCAKLDTELMTDMTALGGEQYAKITALAYRQCFAAGKFVADSNGQPLQFSKENHSNGCIATSDVFYPMAPQFLLSGPTVAKSFLVPFMNYAKSDRWKFPFAPHDLGTYPLANGQVYGGGERTEENQMPVEESGNMILLMAAVAQMEGHADFAGLYWDRLSQWAEYLKDKGFDPENQLCTDDFAGHLAHNVNLSAKAICGLGAYAKLCAMRGEKANAEEYQKTATEFAARWVKEAKDGDHYKLAFDRENSWSQKYNLIWDKILGMNLFPDHVLRTEMDYYLKMPNKYGLPLDNRKEYTKLDWILWTACLTGERKDFEVLAAPIFKFLNEGPSRSPMTDWYETKSGQKVGFTARPVVGGVFAKTLYDGKLWAKYASRDITKAKNWAPMPDYVKPVLKTLVTTAAEDKNILWAYTFDAPAEGWEKPAFDDAAWKHGPGGFGTKGTPNAVLGGVWDSPEIWLRRTITLPDTIPANLAFNIHHDEDVEIYLNGVLAASESGFTENYSSLAIAPEAKATLKPGKNVLAIKCQQSTGGQYIDAGISEIVTKK